MVEHQAGPDQNEHRRFAWLMCWYAQYPTAASLRARIRCGFVLCMMRECDAAVLLNAGNLSAAYLTYWEGKSVSGTGRYWVRASHIGEVRRDALMA